MMIQDLLGTIKEVQAENILLLCHHNADPDAIGSAYALQSLLLRLSPSWTVELGAAQGISRLSKHVLSYVPVNINMQPNVEKAHVIVLLDTNTIQQLDALSERVAKSPATLIVVDHHALHPETMQRAKLCITSEEASSTCEIVYSFYKQASLQPSLDVAKALFLGIAFDTRHFTLASSYTFKVISELVDVGVNAQDALARLAMPMDPSERIARIKACKRAELYRMGNWIIALSHVSSYQASAARALVDLGVHAAAVAGERDGQTEVSLRCTREFNQQTGVHLGRDIAKPLGESLQGMGGGHAAAAGVNGRGDVASALRQCLDLFRAKLGANPEMSSYS
jgi:phosphoesterase RecJ-like protein